MTKAPVSPSHPPLRTPHRRSFLKATAATTAFTIVSPHVLGGPNHVAPSDNIEVAVVGVGGRGMRNARSLMQLKDVVITAVADPADHWDLSNYYYGGEAGRGPATQLIEKHYRKAYANFECKQFIDYREMINQEGICDAILCATPDHHHFGVSKAAIGKGKGVYCEKPLTLFLDEAQQMAQLVKGNNVATQLGNQGHSSDGIRKTCEWIWAGAIGEVKEVHAWVPATRWNKQLTSPPQAAQPKPADLNWDMWCGPRQPVPFHSAYAPVSWRDFWQFGCGAMGDFGCHDLDSSVWALDLDLPRRVEMLPAGQTDPRMTPYGEVGYFDFEKDGKPLRVNWYSGGPRPAHPDAMPSSERLPARGVLFVGTEGLMLCGGAGGVPKLYPEKRRTEFPTPEPSIARSNGHHRDWIDAIKGGPPASSNFQYGSRLTQITLLGVIALRSGKIIRTDGENLVEESVGDPSLVRGSYRDGFG